MYVTLKAYVLQKLYLYKLMQNMCCIYSLNT